MGFGPLSVPGADAAVPGILPCRLLYGRVGYKARFYPSPPKYKNVHPRKVLIVDDSATDRLRLRHVIRRVAPTSNVLEASSADKAYETLAAQPVDLIITDQHMGAVSGLDLLERVRHAHPNAQRIMVTSDEDLELVQEALRRGRVHGYLLKSWSPERLQNVLAGLLDSAGTA